MTECKSFWQQLERMEKATSCKRKTDFNYDHTTDSSIFSICGTQLLSTDPNSESLSRQPSNHIPFPQKVFIQLMETFELPFSMLRTIFTGISQTSLRE